MAPKNAFYAQSGGVTAVINASACGVLQTARQNSQEIGKVYAGRNGIIGALTEDLIDTTFGLRSRDRGAQTYARCCVRVLPVQARLYSTAPSAVRALDRGFRSS